MNAGAPVADAKMQRRIGKHRKLYGTVRRAELDGIDQHIVQGHEQQLLVCPGHRGQTFGIVPFKDPVFKKCLRTLQDFLGEGPQLDL